MSSLRLTAGAEAAAAAEWLRYWDADEQRHYYFHGASQATAWELPPGASWEDGDASLHLLASRR